MSSPPPSPQIPPLGLSSSILAPSEPSVSFLATTAFANSPKPTASSLLNFNQLVDNPVFAGGIGLASLGAVAAFCRRGATQTAGIIRRQLLVNVEISRRDRSYPWVLGWLSQPRDPPPGLDGFLARRLTRIRNLAVSTTAVPIGASSSDDPAGPTRAIFHIEPGYGRHLIRHKPGVYVAVKREKTSTSTTATGEPHETLTLTVLHAHRHVLKDIFLEAHALSARAHEGRTVVYAARRMKWEMLGPPRAKRPLASVVLDKRVKENLVRDVQDFLASRQWYLERGVPYRRGYLLYGPPGTGKTSFIQALAGELNYGVAMINLSEKGITDDLLAQLLTQLPERSLLVLEDVDSALANRRQRDPDGYSGGTVTFSGLLNALDGLSAGEDRISFLTTNHVSRLDPALIRPGRVDMMVRIGEATRWQAAEMWTRYYGDLDVEQEKKDEARERFLARLEVLGLFGPERHTSTAAIQGLFQLSKNDVEGPINMADALIPRMFEPEESSPGSTAKVMA